MFKDVNTCRILAEDYLKQLKNFATLHGLKDIAGVVLDHPKFSYWTGSSGPKYHHYGKHGLIIHTFEVIDTASVNNRLFNECVDYQELFLACLFHDFGKIWDYEPINDDFSEWKVTQHKYNVHHISRSAIEWMKAKEKFNFSDPEDEVLHGILAHHGMRERGSPVLPRTQLAWLLHLSDGLSARMDDCETYNKL